MTGKELLLALIALPKEQLEKRVVVFTHCCIPPVIRLEPADGGKDLVLTT